MSKEKLFCFPYAGGSSTLYEGQFQELKEAYDVISLDYSGHGTKFGLPLNETMDSLLQEAYQEVIEKLSKEESYCLFGYSLGSVVAYEIAWLLINNGFRAPRMLFLCSKDAPHKIPEEEWKHRLSEDDFLKTITDMGGIDEELLSDPLMTRFFLPIIRSDFKIFELYEEQNHGILDTNALVMYSNEDISDEDIHNWDDVITNVEYRCYPGGHFFIYDKHNEVINEILKRRKG